jgi:hypothetical protein
MKRIRKSHSLLSLLFFMMLALSACGEAPKSERTTKANRKIFWENLSKGTIITSLYSPLHEATETQWMGAFWGMGLSNYRPAIADSALKKAWEEAALHTPAFQRALLEVTYQLYPWQYTKEITQFAKVTRNGRNLAMAIYALRQAGENPNLESLLYGKADLEKAPQIRWLMQEKERSLMKRPDIEPLFSLAKKYNSPIIFVFVRENRDYPGILLIQNSDGTFMQEDGRPWFISVLTRSLSNLPGTITNGNTPQGLYSAQGISFSDNIFIGPTPTFVTGLPFELSPAMFFHDTTITKPWSRQLYRDFLPPEWRNYFPFFEAWYAGKAGRAEIIIHGTTINPEFYSGAPYYPMTPSLGCMTTYERWSSFTGRRKISAQQKLIDALLRLPDEHFGYLLLIELDNQNEPVKLSEIVQHIPKKN